MDTGHQIALSVLGHHDSRRQPTGVTLAYPLRLSGQNGGNEAAVISSHNFGMATCDLSFFMIRVFQVIKSDDDACRVSGTMSTYFFLGPFAKSFLGHVGTSKGNPHTYPKAFLTRKSKVGIPYSPIFVPTSRNLIGGGGAVAILSPCSTLDATLDCSAHESSAMQISCLGDQQRESVQQCID